MKVNRHSLQEKYSDLIMRERAKQRTCTSHIDEYTKYPQKSMEEYDKKICDMFKLNPSIDQRNVRYVNQSDKEIIKYIEPNKSSRYVRNKDSHMTLDTKITRLLKKN